MHISIIKYCWQGTILELCQKVPNNSVKPLTKDLITWKFFSRWNWTFSENINSAFETWQKVRGWGKPPIPLTFLCPYSEQTNPAIRAPDPLPFNSIYDSSQVKFPGKCWKVWSLSLVWKSSLLLNTSYLLPKATLDVKTFEGDFAEWVMSSWLPYSTYLYLDFHLFHDKGKRTQQGNLLGHVWRNKCNF